MRWLLAIAVAAAMLTAIAVNDQSSGPSEVRETDPPESLGTSPIPVSTEAGR